MSKSRNSSRGKTDNPNGGFTLIEVVISIGILVIVSLPILHYFTESIRYSSMMERRQQAAFLAQEITEGLLAESELITSGTGGNKYSVPYFEEAEEWKDTVEYKADGTAEELIITAAKDGYTVEVTIDNPDDFDNMRHILDYRIDVPENVIYIDSTENTRAVFEFMGMYNTFYYEPGMDSLTENMIREKMSREMKIGLSKDSGKYRVTLQYVYTCAAFEDEDGNPVSWISGELMNQTVKELSNIYLLCDWCDGGDTISFTTENLDDELGMSLGLYIFCQPRNGDEFPGEGYIMKVDNSGFDGKLLGYTNLSDTQLKADNGRFTKSEKIFRGDTDPAVAYTIHTKVYLKEDLLADIMMTKGE